MTNLSGTNLNNGSAVGPQGEGKESPSNFPKYPAYKDSGVEWLGAVPEGWKVSGIKFFADLITGITPPSDDLDNYAEEGWPWVRPEDLNDSGKPVLASKFLTDQGWRFCRKVKRGSTLICCIGTIGKIGFVDSDVCTNQQITAVVPRGNGRFFFYAMQALKPAFDVSATGNVLRILNSERLGNVTMAVPDHGEAESIARFLDHETARIDALIEEQQRLIELLKEKRQAVISHAVTKGLDPTVPMKDSGVEWLGEVPAHWACGSLARVAERVVVGIAEAATHAYAGEGVPILRATNIRPGQITGELLYINEDFADGLGSKLMRAGDLVTVRTGNAGVTAVVPKELDGCQCFTMLITTLSKGCDSEYYCLLLNSHYAKNYFSLEGWGTAQINISVPILKRLPVPIPPLDEQQTISEYLRGEMLKIDALIDNASEVSGLLSERRSALISSAVTGKIDVRNWQPPAEQYPVGDAQNRTEPEVV